MKINNKIVTTEEVVEIPTFFEPPVVLKPQPQLTIAIMKPKINAFREEQKQSNREIEEYAESIKTDGNILYKIDAINKLLKILVTKEKIFKTGNINIQE
jgi:hypothetical protein